MTLAHWRALVGAELRAELRAGEVLLTTLPFAAAGLLVVAIAVGADVPLLRRLGPGLYWALVLLFGSLVTLRQTYADRPARRDLLALLGIDPTVQWTSRATAATVLLLAFELVLAPVAVVVYDPGLDGIATQLPAVVLVAVGIGALGTLAADLTASARTRTSLVPLIVTPLTLPLVIAAVQLHEGATYGASPWPWLALAMLVDLTIVLAGLLSARPLQESSA
jgi:heme exporter protein B